MLKKYKPCIVAVAGNVGKTSAKDAIAVVLSEIARVRKSEKSYNSELGIPLTILGRASGWNNPWRWLGNIFEGVSLLVFPHHYPDWLVLEVGADRPGDIRRVARWLNPHVVVVTRIGEKPVHVEFFANRESLIREKAYVVEALGAGGRVILNADDQDVVGMTAYTSLKPLTYGMSKEAMVRSSNNKLTYDELEESDEKTVPGRRVIGVTCKVDYKGKSFPVRLAGVFGSANILPALAAFAVGASQGMNGVAIIEALTHFLPPPGRLRLLEGIKGSTIVDDTYNASPAAMRLALESLEEVEYSGKKIAVLADMLELGELTVGAHEEMGALAARICNIIITVGERAKFIAAGAKATGMSEDSMWHFDDARSAGRMLDSMLTTGDIVLIKGSQFMRMERCVEEVMLHPEQKSKLLVRQDKEWLSR